MRSHVHASLRISLILLCSVSLCVLSPVLGTAQTSGSIRTVPDLDLIILVDQSHSQLFTDPAQEIVEGQGRTRQTNRSLAFNALIDTLHVDTLGVNYRIAVILFGTEPVLIQDFTTVRTADTLENLRKTFQSRHTGDLEDMGWTDVNKALQLAYRTFQRGRNPNAKPALVLLTDGKPEIPTANERDHPEAYNGYLDQIWRTYEAYGAADFTTYSGPVCNANPGGPAPLYVVPTIHDVYWRPKFYDVAPYDTFWEKITAIGHTRPWPVMDDIRSLRRTFVNILLELLCLPGEETQPKVPSITTYDVSDIFVQVVFKAIKSNSDITMEVYRPNSDGSATNLADPAQKTANLLQANGSNVKQTESYLDETWGIGRHEPWAGKWTVVLNGQGTVNFFYIRTSDIFRVNMVKPVPGVNYLPVCKPVDVWTQILNTVYQPITEPIKELTIRVLSPDRSSTVVPVTLVRETYQSRFDGVSAEGEYDVTVDAMVEYEGSPGPLSYKKSFVARLWPWLDPFQPVAGESYPDSEALPLAATLKVGCDPNPSAQNMIVTVALLRGGEVVGTYSLTLAPQVGEGVFSHTIPAGVLTAVGGKPTEYTAIFSVQSDTMQGLEREQSEVTFKVEPRPVRPPTPTWTPTLPPTLTATAVPPTATDSPMPPSTVAPTAIPTPMPPETSSSLPWPVLGAAFLSLSVLGVGLLWFQRPSLAGMTLSGPGGVIALGKGLTSRIAHNVRLHDGDGKTLATLRVEPGGTRTEPTASMRVVGLSEGIDEIVFNRAPQQKGDLFEIKHNQILQVGGERYTFDNPSEGSRMPDNDYRNLGGGDGGAVSPTEPIARDSLIHDDWSEHDNRS